MVVLACGAGFNIEELGGRLMTRASSNVLVDQFTLEGSILLDVVWVSGFAGLTALMAQFYVRLPFTPVPLTGQTLAVLASGALLGCRRGFLSQGLYLALGAMGLPVFAGGAGSLTHLMGTNGGYLLSFPLAAALLGCLVELGASRTTWKLALALVAADVLVLALGVAWLWAVWGGSVRNALMLGLYPFVVSDIMKIFLLGVPLPWLLGRAPVRWAGAVGGD
jgi:biotin transport system substrate-specific component